MGFGEFIGINKWIGFQFYEDKFRSINSLGETKPSGGVFSLLNPPSQIFLKFNSKTFKLLIVY